MKPPVGPRNAFDGRGSAAVCGSAGERGGTPTEIGDRTVGHTPGPAAESRPRGMLPRLAHVLVLSLLIWSFSSLGGACLLQDVGLADAVAACRGDARVSVAY